MVYYVGTVEKVSDTFEKSLGNSSFYLKFIFGKIHQRIEDKGYQFIQSRVFSIFPL